MLTIAGRALLLGAVLAAGVVPVMARADPGDGGTRLCGISVCVDASEPATPAATPADTATHTSTRRPCEAHRPRR